MKNTFTTPNTTPYTPPLAQTRRRSCPRCARKWQHTSAHFRVTGSCFVPLPAIGPNPPSSDSLRTARLSHPPSHPLHAPPASHDTEPQDAATASFFRKGLSPQPPLPCHPPKCLNADRRRRSRPPLVRPLSLPLPPLPKDKTPAKLQLVYDSKAPQTHTKSTPPPFPPLGHMSQTSLRFPLGLGAAVGCCGLPEDSRAPPPPRPSPPSLCAVRTTCE